MIDLLLAATVAANAPAPVPPTPAAKSAPAPAKHADLGAISANNPFDQHRTAWNPPPEPPGPGLTEDEVKVHGVILTGQTKKALVELVSPSLIGPTVRGKPAPRPFRVVGVGDDIGGYRVVDITPSQLVFAQGKNQSTLAFTLTKGRGVSGGAVAAPEQVAVVVPVIMPTVLEGVTAPVAAPEPAPSQSAATPAPIMPSAPTTPTNTADSGAQPDNGSGNGNGSPAPQAGMSLLEAIQAARARAAAGGTPTNNGNPFAMGGTGK